uniref:Transcription factor 24 n=1 Tax=Salvator merianae TaxID=96440 RepID=A0A8D0C6Z2_SALMN
MDYRNRPENCKELSVPCSDSSSLPNAVSGADSLLGQRAVANLSRPAAANAARERSRVQTLRHAFLELQRTLPSVPPDTKLSKLDVLLLATTYIAHLTRSLQDEEESPGEGLGTLRGDGYLHPVKVILKKLHYTATQYLKFSDGLTTCNERSRGCFKPHSADSSSTESSPSLFLFCLA